MSLVLSSCAQGTSSDEGPLDTAVAQAADTARTNPLQELPVDDQRWTDKFDRYFRKYSKRFFGVGLNWRWFKAQGIAESGLRQDARSWVGAKGIMQIMPSTFQEISEQTRIKTISDPKWNIPAGIFYDRYLYESWDSITASQVDRLAFTFSSYNSGRGRTRQATRTCGSPDCTEWRKVQEHAPEETRNYVNRIMTLMGTTGY